MGGCLVKLKSCYESILNQKVAYFGAPDDIEQGHRISMNSEFKSDRPFDDIRPDINLAVNSEMVADHAADKDDVKEIST